jgi:hypothetical protein
MCFATASSKKLFKIKYLRVQKACGPAQRGQQSRPVCDLAHFNQQTLEGCAGDSAQKRIWEVETSLTSTRLRAIRGEWIEAAIAAPIAHFESGRALAQALESGRINLRTRTRSGAQYISAASLCAYLNGIALLAEGGLM